MEEFSLGVEPWERVRKESEPLCRRPARSRRRSANKEWSPAGPTPPLSVRTGQDTERSKVAPHHSGGDTGAAQHTTGAVTLRNHTGAIGGTGNVGYRAMILCRFSRVRMVKPDIRIQDIAEFIPAVWQLRANWFPHDPNWGPWFRGHTHDDWKLVPKLFRRATPKRPIRVIEDEIRQEFTMRAPGLSGISDDKPQNPWDWYFTMQHSGAPTRLLDWTEGALIALYFAVRDSDGSRDAAVWALDPWWLNEQTVGQREVVPPGATVGISEEDAARYRPWLPDRYAKTKLEKPPVAVYPSHTARRISTQRSCFTVHGSDVKGLEKLRREKDARIVKIIVSSSGVRRIAQQLVICGIDEVTIFPDLDGLGRLLSAMLKIETDL